MNYGLPDWMFAAFAIGGWELFDLMARHWHWSQGRFVGAAIVAVCCVVLLMRYLMRWLRRRRQDPDQPEDWRDL